MELRKIIYLLLLLIIIIIFLSSISVNVSYSDNSSPKPTIPVQNNGQNTDPLYVNSLNNVNKSNTIYAKIVNRPDISVHKQLLAAENQFYSNRCN